MSAAYARGASLEAARRVVGSEKELGCQCGEGPIGLADRRVKFTFFRRGKQGWLLLAVGERARLMPEVRFPERCDPAEHTQHGQHGACRRICSGYAVVAHCKAQDQDHERCTTV